MTTGPAWCRLGAALLCGLSLGAGAATDAAAPVASPEDFLEARGCAIVVGGAVGSSFAEPAVAGFWHDVNKSISDTLYGDLVIERYRVVRLTVPVAQAGDIVPLVVKAMARQRCSRVLQLSTDVGEDGEGRYFGFVVSLLRVVPKETVAADGTNTVTRGEYRRRYRFGRDAGTMDRFRTGAFARVVLGDLKAAGVLEAVAGP